MQRRHFIAALAGAVGAVVGMVKGGSALVAEAKGQGLATGGPVTWRWHSSTIGTIHGGYYSRDADQIVERLGLGDRVVFCQEIEEVEPVNNSRTFRLTGEKGMYLDSARLDALDDLSASLRRFNGALTNAGNS